MSDGGSARVTEELRIGVNEGAPEYLLGRVTDVAVGPDGSIFVAELLPSLVRMYDADGRFMREVGQPGQGPGEYGQIMGIETLPDGRLVLWDIDNRRLNYYDPSGTFLDSVAVQATLHAARVLNVDVHGNVLVTSTHRDDAPAPQLQKRTLIRVSPEGEVRGSVSLPDEHPEDGGFVLSTAEGYVPNFTISTRNAWSPLGYVVSGRNDNYVLQLLEDGEGIGEIRRAYEPVPIVGEERAQWEAWTRFFESRRAPEGFGGAPPSVFHDIPEYKPAFKEIYVGSDGLIWVHRYVEAQRRDGPPRDADDERPAFNWREPAVFDVFEPGGTLVWEVTLPPNTYVHARRGEMLWASQTDDLGVTRVLRLRVVGTHAAIN